MNSISGAISMTRVLGQVASYELEDSFRYDWIILSRPDLILLKKFNFDFLTDDGAVYFDGDRGGDFTFAMSSRVARRFSEISVYPTPKMRVGWKKEIGYGWHTTFVEKVVTPGKKVIGSPMWMGQANRDYAVSRKLCSSGPMGSFSKYFTLERWKLLQEWGFTCGYISRLPNAMSSSSACCTFCEQSCTKEYSGFSRRDNLHHRSNNASSRNKIS